MGSTGERAAVTVLSGVDALFADERNWCKGRAVAATPHGGLAFCMLGAVDHVAAELGIGARPRRQARRMLRRSAGTLAISAFNDRSSTTIVDVRRVVKEALAALDDRSGVPVPVADADAGELIG